jgi:hypothetical protein
MTNHDETRKEKINEIDSPIMQCTTSVVDKQTTLKQRTLHNALRLTGVVFAVTLVCFVLFPPRNSGLTTAPCRRLLVVLWISAMFALAVYYWITAQLLSPLSQQRPGQKRFNTSNLDLKNENQLYDDDSSDDNDSSDESDSNSSSSSSSASSSSSDNDSTSSSSSSRNSNTSTSSSDTDSTSSSSIDSRNATTRHKTRHGVANSRHRKTRQYQNTKRRRKHLPFRVPGLHH